MQKQTLKRSLSLILGSAQTVVQLDQTWILLLHMLASALWV